MKLPLLIATPVKLDAAALTWFNNLKNQYLTLTPPAALDAGIKAKTCTTIDLLLAKDSKDLVMQELFDLEDLILVLLSGPPLVARLKSLRDEYQDVFGDDKWKQVQPTLLPVIDPAKDDENRAEARRLQEELHWQASIRPWASDMRDWMMTTTLGVTAGVLIMACILAAFGGMKFESVLVFAGVLGGAVSSIQRIQSANLATSRALMLARYSTLKLGVVISPLLGGIFAVLLALMLMSKTVAPGTVIPNVVLGYAASNSSVRESAPAVSTGTWRISQKRGDNTNPSAAASLGESTNAPLVTAAGTNGPDISHAPAAEESAATPSHRPFQPETPVPCRFSFFSMPVIFASGQDLALFLLWMFLAGFSERLVPDLLTKVAESKKP